MNKLNDNKMKKREDLKYLKIPRNSQFEGLGPTTNRHLVALNDTYIALAAESVEVLRSGMAK